MCDLSTLWLVARSCARPGCNAEPVATLWYDYRQRTGLLDPLLADPHPMAYDLCSRHADTTSVPLGWSLDDRRRPQLSATSHDAGRVSPPEGNHPPYGEPLAS